MQLPPEPARNNNNKNKESANFYIEVSTKLLKGRESNHAVLELRQVNKALKKRYIKYEDRKVAMNYF